VIEPDTAIDCPLRVELDRVEQVCGRGIDLPMDRRRQVVGFVGRDGPRIVEVHILVE
jgi:hypothetical protein